LNKIDAITDPNELNCIQKTLSDKGWVCFPISAVVGEGLSALLHYALDLIDKTAVFPIHVIEKAPPASEEDRNIVVTEEDGIFIVQNKGIERLILRTNLDNEDAVDRLQLTLRKLGVFSALREAGIAEGQSVKIGTAVFSFFDEEPE
ncbi:MAG: Obg family GTPase CgtA, partial [bacterium]|nr:Obg family GTPase CgtA [bacterium]